MGRGVLTGRLNRRERDRAQRRRLLEFLSIALLVHLASVPLLSFLVPKPGPEPKRTLRVVSLVPKNKIKGPTPPQKKRPPKPKIEEKEKLAELEGQVVDLPPSPDDTPPEDARYLSEYNTRTERETASRNRSKNYEVAMNERSRANKGESQAPSKASARALQIDPSPQPPSPETDAQEQAQKMALELPDLRRQDPLNLEFDAESGQFRNKKQVRNLKGNSKRLRLALDEEGRDSADSSAPKKGPRLADLVPDIGVLARLDGGPANDHLEDIEEGEGTFLNSREFKFASFFNRMKRGVSQHWRPLAEYRRRDPSGNIYGQRARVTVLDVTLNSDGSLKGVQVTRSSGVEFLDREAVAAFQRAEPFPNPPNGLVNKDTGDISFPFGFHIDFSPRGGIRLPF